MGIEAAGNIAFDDLQSEKKFGWFRGLAQSKLANVLFTYESARRFDSRGIRVHCLNPGGVKTGLGQNTTGLPKLLMSVGRLFFQEAETAAKTIVSVLQSEEARSSTGKYFGPDGKLAKSSPRSHDRQMASRLWEVSAELSGLA